jgi:hypothetical protein
VCRDAGNELVMEETKIRVEYETILDEVLVYLDGSWLALNTFL